MDLGERKRRSPYDRANFLSRLFFAWVTPLFIKSFKRPLREDEIFNIGIKESSLFLTETMIKEWEKELRKSRPNLFKVLIAIFWKKYFLLGLVLFIENAFNLVQALVIWMLLSSVKSIHTDLKPSLIYSTCLVVVVMLIILLRNPYYFYTLRMGMQVKVGISGLIYHKILRLNQKALCKTGTGQIINLLSNDVHRFEMGLPHLHYVWIGPCVTVVAIGLLYLFSKEGGLASLLVLFLIIPVQVALGGFYNKLRSKVAVLTDERIKMVSELINGMRVVKMYCWEQMFIKVIGELRSKELHYIFHNRLGLTTQFSQMIFQSKIAICIMMLVVYYFDLGLRSSQVFSTVVLLAVVRDIFTRFVPYCVLHMHELRVSISRVQTFLTLPELTKEGENKDFSLSIVSLKENSVKNDDNFEITLKHANACWNFDDFTKLTLNDVSFTVTSPRICAIVGEVGSGKSSLLMAILGELPCSSGEIYVKGRISYASQQPWVFSGTILENVLFNAPRDLEKIAEIMKSTTLYQDVNVMPKGLNTAVGERGVTLSGGQKARVSLARAAYTDADIILLDDPLAAVDASVSQNIFFHCIKDMFKNKLVMLVTHQLHLLEHVDQIILLKNGCLLAVGTFADIKSQGFDLHTLLKTEKLGAQKILQDQIIHDSAYFNPLQQIKTLNVNASNRVLETLPSDSVPLLPIHSNENNGIILANGTDPKDEQSFQEDQEAYSTGTVGLHIYWTYVTTGCPSFVTLLVMILYICTMFLYIFFDIWLSLWTREMDKRNITNSDFYHDDFSFLLGLLLLGLGNFIFGVLSVGSLFMVCISSSRVLHNNMLKSILKSPMAFFDTTPAGRILNRFSKDMGIVDDVMPVTVQDLVITSYLVLFGLGLSIFKNYWCIIIVAPLFVLFLILRRSYINVARSIKRIEATTRSPLFDHVSNTLQGLTTIRGFKSQQWFIDSFYAKQDRHSKAFFLYISTSRWFAFRLDEICLVFITGVTYSCVALIFYGRIMPSDFGLILTYIIGFIGLTQWAIRQSAEVENQMISVERIYEYSNLEPEKEIINETKNISSTDWPKSGKIQFEDVTLFYEKYGPLILNNVNLRIEDKEKIGIVGRTGAGKSSLISALFRLIELPPNCGRIMIDDWDISSLTLTQLRSSIAVIPQDPVLFMGNIRRNLDPFSEFDDCLLWEVLDTVELKETIYGLADKLCSAVSEGGSNLSVGQRQLLCMARALLKKTRVMIIDEATANVDPRTDQLIQRTLKTKFLFCTVLTIAHRLNTIMDSDKILVMSEGKVAEFDHPHILLTNHPNGIFANLIKKTGSLEENRLRKVAETNYGLK